MQELGNNSGSSDLTTTDKGKLGDPGKKWGELTKTTRKIYME